MFNRLDKPDKTTDADSLRRRVHELKADKAALQHQLRAVRLELATLRGCLSGAQPPRLAKMMCDAFEEVPLFGDAVITLRAGGAIHEQARADMRAWREE